MQSAHRINLPVSMDDMRFQERQLWELISRGGLLINERNRSASLEEAIAAFDARFGD